MNPKFLQNILIKAYFQHIDHDTPESIVDLGANYTNLQACIELISYGLNIDQFIKIEQLGDIKNICIAEYVCQHSNNYDIIKLTLSSSSNEFLNNLENNVKEIMLCNIADKNFSVNEKMSLMNYIFQAGYKLISSNNELARELDWVELGYTEIFDLIIIHQPEFNFNKIYNIDEKNISLIEYIEQKINNLEQLDPNLKSIYNMKTLVKLKNLNEHIKKIALSQKLKELLSEKNEQLIRIKI